MDGKSIIINKQNADDVVNFLTEYGIKDIYIKGDMVCINKGSTSDEREILHLPPPPPPAAAISKK